MKKTIGICLVAAVCASAAVLLGAEDSEKKKEIPVGMEEIKFGKINMVVPKGMKTKKRGNHITLEDVNEYLARRLEEMENAIKKVETRVKALEKTTKEQNAIFKHNLENVKLDIEDIKKALAKKADKEKEEEAEE